MKTHFTCNFFKSVFRSLAKNSATCSRYNKKAITELKSKII